MSITARLFRGVVNAIFDATNSNKFIEDKIREIQIDMINSLNCDDFFKTRINNLDLINLEQFSEFNEEMKDAYIANYNISKEYIIMGNIFCLAPLSCEWKPDLVRKYFLASLEALLRKIRSDQLSVFTPDVISKNYDINHKLAILYHFSMSFIGIYMTFYEKYSRTNYFYNFPLYLQGLAKYKFDKINLKDFLYSFLTVYSYATLYPTKAINNSFLFSDYFSYSYKKYKIDLNLNNFSDSVIFQKRLSKSINKNSHFAKNIDLWRTNRMLIDKPFNEHDFDLLLESHFKVSLLSEYQLSIDQIEEVYSDLLNKLSEKDLKHTLFLFYSLESFLNLDEVAYTKNIVKLSNEIIVQHPELKVVIK